MVLILLCFSVSHSVAAHSGRTDSNGGHNCSPKSVSKGLCTGYHYHNGGGSSSSSSNSSNSTSAETKSAAQIAQEEKQLGEKEGYAIGVDAGYEGQKNDSHSSGSEAYQEGYKIGYEKGYAEGLAKLEEEKKKLEEAKKVAKQSGYEQGLDQDDISIPDEYKENTSLKIAYESGFKKGVSERDEANKEKYMAQGIEDGISDTLNEPKDVKDIYLEAYNQGYEEGRVELKESYVKQGYEAAFTMLAYGSPDLSNDKYIEWYKEGFESNTDIVSIQNVAYNMGLNGEELIIPEEYSKAQLLYEYYYDLGNQQRKEDNRKTAGFFGAGMVAWLGRRFYVAKKMLK
jgi:hypothetical protein